MIRPIRVHITFFIRYLEQSRKANIYPTTPADTANRLVISHEGGETVVSRVAVSHTGDGQEVRRVNLDITWIWIMFITILPPTLLLPPCRQPAAGIILKSESCLSWLVLL